MIRLEQEKKTALKCCIEININEEQKLYLLLTMHTTEIINDLPKDIKAAK